jgi:formamidopyrimidine-DNA glycosylase
VPELPDLLYVRARLEQALVGRSVIATRVRKPVVLRCLVPGDLSLLTGATLKSIERRLHFLVFSFERKSAPGAQAVADHDLLVNPMLAGRFRLAAPADRNEAALAFALDFGNPELRYLDDKQMGKAYLTAPATWDAIPGLASRGLDVLSPEFTLARFMAALKGRRDQVRVFLLDKSALDSLGNAYADEVLFAAGLHPKTWCRSLSPDDAARLHAAIVTVLKDAAAEVERRREPTEVKVRDFLKVRLKETCPKCGGKIRRAGVRGMDAYFCPRCQPETRAGLVDWRKAP